MLGPAGRVVVAAIGLSLLAGCAHKPLSGSDLYGSKLIAFISRIEDEAGPKSRVFRDDSSYRPTLAPRRIDDKEADRRLANVLVNGSTDRATKAVIARTITRFEVADSLRATTLSLLPPQKPWTEVVHPADVARTLESFLVQEVPANAPDYQRLKELGADTVVEIVVEEFGMRSEGGRAGVFLKGHARMFRIDGGELYHRYFVSDDIHAGLEHLDPFAVAKNSALFADRVKQMLNAISAQIAKDLTPADQVAPVPTGPAGEEPVRRKIKPEQDTTPDPL